MIDLFRVLVKDLFFQEKYRLSHTQVDVMAYIINALAWTIKVGVSELIESNFAIML
jgi:hypothetical protein